MDPGQEGIKTDDISYDQIALRRIYRSFGRFDAPFYNEMANDDVKYILRFVKDTEGDPVEFKGPL